MGFVWFS